MARSNINRLEKETSNMTEPKVNEIEPCPRCGGCSGDWRRVECIMCGYRTGYYCTLDDAITTHNELCRQLKPAPNLPRMVEVSLSGKNWVGPRRLVGIIDGDNYPFITKTKSLTVPECWKYMREIPAAPKRVPLEFEDYLANRDMWVKSQACDNEYRITGFNISKKVVHISDIRLTCLQLHSNYSNLDGSPLEKDAE
jgi:hypothetical protein